MSETRDPVGRSHADGRPRRLADCAIRNPGNDETHQSCCRFPKSCSPYPHPETPVTEADLEPRRSTTPETRDPVGGGLAAAVLALCEAAKRDNYGRLAVDVDDLHVAIGRWLGVHPSEDLREELAERAVVAAATAETPPTPEPTTVAAAWDEGYHRAAVDATADPVVFTYARNPHRADAIKRGLEGASGARGSDLPDAGGPDVDSDVGGSSEGEGTR